MPIAPKLVILDRDGVINQDSDHYIKSLDEWTPYPSAIDAIARLSRDGWTVAVATNQSGIARGYFDDTVVDEIHAHLVALVEAAGGKIEQIVYCPHGPDDDCECRKPRSGLLATIRDRLGLAGLERGWMVGDSLRDLQAGEAIGCRSALVRTGKGRETEAKGEGLAQARVFDDLSAFVTWLIEDSVAVDDSRRDDVAPGASALGATEDQPKAS
ncbi:D-glycero-beta-D-manno-heptose 1,7-bisphosphate 7-phosphatase [Halomonas sp. YLGW01]|uniref:D-glycero-beta-D-manno-heptose 1,7-bisphosphate 7-phosphatase n=1 Tax=Halomonas sp. YLGW01 TaxID=2773308 RepID=UPI0017872914|nr:D-glycero-beta-D-manno-heptose 1,7-bisphosphate 7-phosphatase [Halomonas sp. YLGW01]